MSEELPEHTKQAVKTLRKNQYPWEADFIEENYTDSEIFTKEELIQAVEKVQAKAGNHGMDYAGGMRNATSEIEKELLTNNETE